MLPCPGPLAGGLWLPFSATSVVLEFFDLQRQCFQVRFWFLASLPLLFGSHNTIRSDMEFQVSVVQIPFQDLLFSSVLF